MRKYVKSFIVIAMILVFMCGCGQKNSTPLTIYVVQTEALYKTALESFVKDYPEAKVNVVYFESYDKMQEQLSTELMSGEGPDVLLFNSLYSVEDPYKLSDSGALLVLDEYMEKMAPDVYYSTILNAGKMNGHQYFIPLSWNILQAYSSQQLIDEKGYEDLYVAIPVEAETLNDNETACMSNLDLGRTDVLNCFMEIAGNSLFDMDKGELIVNKEEIRETTEYVKVFYDNSEKISLISDRYRNDFVGAASHYTYLVEDYPFMNNFRYYHSVYPMLLNQDMYFAPFVRRDSGVTAQVIQYGAISAHTKNEGEAWKLLQYICDAQVSMDYSKYNTQSIFFAPVNQVRYEDCITELCSAYAPGPGRKVSPLNSESAQLLRDMPGQITEAVIPSSSYGMLIQECMEPYLYGEDTFDKCYDTLVQRTKLYLNE